MITPSLGLTATERVLPKLALDFTTALLDSRVTFTRTTGASNPATYTNSNGVITTATNNQPRFDYDPVTLACKGLLIEESRTNLLTNSEAFNAWTAFELSVTADQIVSPNGAINADLITASAGSGYHEVDSANVSITSGTTYTVTLFAKAGTHNFVQIYLPTTLFGSTAFANFNVSTGVVGTKGASVISSSIAPYANGFYRLQMTLAATATGTNGVFIQLAASATSGKGANWSAAGTETIYLWGAQLEAGAFATSYIPTTTAALTRNADVATMTGTDFSDWFNASEGSFVVKTGTLNGSSASGFSIDNGTSSNQIIVPYNNSKCFVVLDGGAVQVNAGGSIASGNCSVIYKANDFYTARNAGGADTDTSGTVPTVSQMGIGCRPYGPSFFANGCIQQINYWPMRLLNAEGLAISK
jgi:hypothetical protein